MSVYSIIGAAKPRCCQLLWDRYFCPGPLCRARSHLIMPAVHLHQSSHDNLQTESNTRPPPLFDVHSTRDTNRTVYFTAWLNCNRKYFLGTGVDLIKFLLWFHFVIWFKLDWIESNLYKLMDKATNKLITFDCFYKYNQGYCSQ